MPQFIATVLDWVPGVFETLLALSLFVFAPLAILKKTRALAGIAFMIVAQCFAVITWISSAATVYVTCGFWILVFSTMAAGVGTVVVAIVATLMRGDAHEILGLTVIIAATIGSAFAGLSVCPRSFYLFFNMLDAPHFDLWRNKSFQIKDSSTAQPPC